MSPSDGAHWNGEATHFVVTAAHADGVELCIFHDEESLLELTRRSDGRFEAEVPGAGPGTRYGYRVHGPFEPARGHRHNPSKLLLDPYGLRVAGLIRPSSVLLGHDPDDPSRASDLDSAPFTMRSVVADAGFDWRGSTRPATPLAESVIYETHVKGLTMTHPGVPRGLRGTFAGLASDAVLDHLTSLGVTAVELMPVAQNAPDPHLLASGRTNYWGYSTIGFFAPHHQYAASDDPVGEFQSMVRTLHAAGIEVILDVVYNHTAEGGATGPTLCFKGLDNHTWYRLEPSDNSQYVNWTGTGNTLDLRSPTVLTFVLDSLRHWVDVMGVDGFRFDLATTLGRTHREFDALGGFFGAVSQDPVLRHVKLIAEPWDVGPGGYRVGDFPRPWSEWNDKFRDSVRDFWRAADGALPTFATRFTGSSDVYRRHRRSPQASVNYVCSHDGFTLADLVTFEQRRNHANGESNQDGHRDNRSWNSGVEGPTTDPSVSDLRTRRRKSMLATAILAQGVPMVLGGDEIGRSQAGNNNAYNQDNQTSWYDWSSADEDFLEFTREVIALRREHPGFRSTAWLDDVSVSWFTHEGTEMTPSSWQDPQRRHVGLRLAGELYLAFNGSSEAVDFEISGDGDWEPLLDTASSPSSWPRVEAFALTLLRRKGQTA